MASVTAPDDNDDFRRERACRVLESGRISIPADIEDLLCLNTSDVLPLLVNGMQHRTPIVRARAAAAMRRFDAVGFAALIAALQNGPTRQQQAAAEALGAWGDRQAAPYLIAALEKAQQDKQSSIVKNIILGYFFLMIMVFVWLIDAIRNQVQGNVSSESYRITLIEALGKLNDIRAVPILARLAVRSGTGSHSLWAQHSLQKLLPCVSQLLPEQAHWLGTNGVTAIVMLLTHRNALLVESALDALRAVGDGRAIPAVNRIANGMNPTLAQKARLLLPILMQRAQSEAARMTLLRGSSTPQPVHLSTELLRAAQPSFASNQPDQLLRATISPENTNER